MFLFCFGLLFLTPVVYLKRLGVCLFVCVNCVQNNKIAKRDRNGIGNSTDLNVVRSQVFGNLLIVCLAVERFCYCAAELCSIQKGNVKIYYVVAIEYETQQMTTN